MENQIDNSKEINAKGIILLVGAILGALTAWVASGTFLSIITGLIGGFVFAIIFISIVLPFKSHDR